MSIGTIYASLELAEPPYQLAGPGHEEQPSDWMARALAAYMRRYDAEALRGTIARQVRLLTGRSPAPEQIWADGERRVATAVVDGAVFRLEQGELRLMRPCAHCGVGQIASAPLRSEADLGYALGFWEPLHADCEPEDAADDA